MVSPYLSRPLRSLREARGSSPAPPQPRSDPAEAAAARPEAAEPLTPPLAPPLAPGRPLRVVAGEGPEPAPGNGSDRGDA